MHSYTERVVLGGNPSKHPNYHQSRKEFHSTRQHVATRRDNSNNSILCNRKCQALPFFWEFLGRFALQTQNSY